MSIVVKVVQSFDILDNTKVAQFHREIEGCVEAGTKIVLLDLKNIKFINSSGLMALGVVFKVVRAAGSKLFVCSMSQQVRMIFEMTGVDQVVETFANLDEFNNTVLVKRSERLGQTAKQIEGIPSVASQTNHSSDREGLAISAPILHRHYSVRNTG